MCEIANKLLQSRIVVAGLAITIASSIYLGIYTMLYGNYWLSPPDVLVLQLVTGTLIVLFGTGIGMIKQYKKSKVDKNKDLK